jgi:hypothetical protein
VKILKIVVAGFASVALLAGCGADNSEMKKEVVGDWWSEIATLDINDDGTGSVVNTDNPSLGNGDFEWKIKGESFVITYTGQDKKDDCTLPYANGATAPIMDCTSLGTIYKTPEQTQE